MRREYDQLKLLIAVYNARCTEPAHRVRNMHDMARYIFTKLDGDKLKTMCRLVTHAVIIPMSSAKGETGFFFMNFIKDKHRSTLSQTALEALMNIKINGPTVDDFERSDLPIRILHTWADTAAGRQVNIGEHLSRSEYHTASQELQHMIRTGNLQKSKPRSGPSGESDEEEPEPSVYAKSGAASNWSYAQGTFSDFGASAADQRSSKAKRAASAKEKNQSFTSHRFIEESLLTR